MFYRTSALWGRCPKKGTVSKRERKKKKTKNFVFLKTNICHFLLLFGVCVCADRRNFAERVPDASRDHFRFR